MGEGAFFLAFVASQRLVELWLANRNTKRLLARGAREVGAGHYPLFIILNTAWLLLLFWVARDLEVSLPWFGAYAVLQIVRIWIIASLGERWTTRIIVIDEPLIRRGPYAHVNHPNYMLVAAEFVIIPMVVHQPEIAIVFFLLNAALLCVRLRVENAALKEVAG